MMRITRNFMSAMLFGSNRTTSTRSRMMDRLQSTNLTSYNSLLGTRALNQASSTQIIYQNMKNNAGELQNSASKLLNTGENSIYSQAKESGNTAEVTEQIQDFVTYYNGMVRSLKSGSSRVDSSYLNMLNSYSSMYQSALKTTGVTKQTDGTLSVDTKAFQKTNLEQYGAETILLQQKQE